MLLSCSLIVRRTAMRLYSSAPLGNQAISPLTSNAKSNLFKLRKHTGYPISNCKKALEVNDNDIKKALEWLNALALKEGWAKAQKVQGRKTSQGLVGIKVNNNVAAMVEVNCETDFVSRNQEFHDLVQTVTNSCSHGNLVENSLSIDDVSKKFLTMDNISSLPWVEEDNKKLSDLLALKIGQLGENMSLTRAVCLHVSNDLKIGYYAHPNTPNDVEEPGFVAGKYGSIVAYKLIPPLSIANLNESDDNAIGNNVDTDDEKVQQPVARKLTTSECARQLCQHIVGMNPSTIGERRDEPVDIGEKKNEQSDIDENNDNDRDNCSEDETQLLRQEFLIDPTLTVGDFLQKNGIKVVDFIRYECGETQEESL